MKVLKISRKSWKLNKRNKKRKQKIPFKIFLKSDSRTTLIKSLTSNSTDLVLGMKRTNAHQMRNIGYKNPPIC